MVFKHYDVVRAASPSDLAEKLTHKLKEGWQPFGSPVAITPYTLMQAIAAEGDVVVSGATEPEWYYVIVLAGQSNAMAYGEGLPLPDSYDAPHPRIKQLARRNTVTPGGKACAFNDIIPADHCLHDVQDMSALNHPKADLSKGQYGCVGQGLHIAKKLLPYIPNNAGILLVPCCRGGSAFTQGAEGTFSADTGASQDSARWGVGKPLYQDLIARTKAALQKNPKNVLLAVCWMQGEFDMSAATYAQQPDLFTAMLKQFRTDLSGFNAQCHGGSAAVVPWICGDTTYYWKNTYGTQYDSVYGAYKNRESDNVFFVPFMTDGNGNNTPTNLPAEDPDIADAGYYGAQSRSNGNWVSSNRPTHFSSWARRSIIPDRMATAILNAAGRTSAFISGKAPEIKPSPGVDTPSGPSEDASVRTISLLPTAGEAAAQGWTIKDGGIQLSGGVFKITKQSNKTWSLMHPVDDAVSLLTRGGRLSCKFRLSGALTNNQFGLGIYLYTDVALPDVVAMTGTGNPFLMSFFTQTTDGKLNLMHHRKAGNTKLGEFGKRRQHHVRRNLSHIIAAAFNEPLLLEPAYARVFFCALGREMGAASLSVPQQQVQFDAPGMLAETDEYMAGGKRPARVYRVVNGIAVLPVTGTLVHRLGGMRPFSGMTGYDGIVACLQQAMSVDAVTGTEAAVFEGQSGIEAGLADELINASDAISVMATALNSNVRGGTMPQLTATEAAVQENQRVMGILTCQEAKGREQLATMLAGQQGMSVEQARAILAAAAPQQPVASAQSEADRIMACEEANGREQLAATLAAMPEMTVEKARPILAAAPLADAGPSLRDQIMALDEAKGAEAQAEKLAACPGMTVENARAVLAAGSGKAEPVSASTTALFEHFMANHSPAAVRGGVSQTSADGDADVKMLMAMP